ncbi:TPA: hypothetical protein MJD05_08770 [Klebsiella pneumoniae]|nr:hypothetical protein [Klebsiella pneumoniae]
MSWTLHLMVIGIILILPARVILHWPEPLCVNPIGYGLSYHPVIGLVTNSRHPSHPPILVDTSHLDSVKQICAVLCAV